MGRTIPLLWRGGRHKHFVMRAFNNHVKVLDNVTPIDLLVQSAVLSDGVVYIIIWRGAIEMIRGSDRWLENTLLTT